MSAPRRLVADLRDARPVYTVPDWALAEIRAALPEGWEMTVVEAPADGSGDGGAVSPEAVEAVRGAEVYLGHGVPREVFRAATEPPGSRLRWVHSASAGVGGALYPEMLAWDGVLTNSAGIYAEPMADTVLAMLLHFARGLDLAAAAQARRAWDKAPFVGADTPVRELAGSTLGILGLGGIGRAVARRGLALGMRVAGMRRHPGPGPEGVEMLAGAGALEALLERSDFLVVATPLTPETRGMVGEAELARMRPGAVLVNVARGEVVDEEALARALAAGWLRGAGLDVFATEPLPPSSPLWGLPNALLTPHISGISHSFWRRQTALVTENLGRYLGGKPLLNAVDKAAGY